MENMLVIVMLIMLSLIILLLTYMVFKLNQELTEERLAFNKERSDLINRVISKSTSEYRELTKVNAMPNDTEKQKKRKSPIDEQLEQIGALEYGATNMYKGM